MLSRVVFGVLCDGGRMAAILLIDWLAPVEGEVEEFSDRRSPSIAEWG
jgi:hypothetical protein